MAVEIFMGGGFMQRARAEPESRAETNLSLRWLGAGLGHRVFRTHSPSRHIERAPGFERNLPAAAGADQRQRRSGPQRRDIGAEQSARDRIEDSVDLRRAHPRLPKLASVVSTFFA
jgi:hypothetical protein